MHRVGDRRERAVLVVGHERGRGAGGERLLAEVASPSDRHEEAPRLYRPRSDRHAANLLRPRADVQPPEGRDFIEWERDHPSTSARRASRATWRSSNGWITPAISCPCSCPFPAI